MKSDIKEAIDKAGIEDEKVIEKLLRIHGQDIPASNLSGALDIISEKYQLNEFRSFDVVDSQSFDDEENSEQGRPKPATLSKKNIVNYIRKLAREARGKRVKVRRPHARDRLDGRIGALDDILRYLKKR